MNRTFRRGLRQGATRLAQMAAVLKTALPQKTAEFDETRFDVLRRQVMQAELLQAGAIDQGAVGVQTVEPGLGCGVAAGSEKMRDFPGGDARIRQQRVDDGGLAHAGLPDQ